MSDPGRIALVHKDSVRLVDVSEVARALSGEDDVASSLKRIAGLDEHVVQALAKRVTMTAASDTLSSDEYEALERALHTHLSDRFGDRVPVRGYIDGERVLIDGRTFALTGETCTSCRINPTAYANGGGEMCVDESDCGWWFCW